MTNEPTRPRRSEPVMQADREPVAWLWCDGRSDYIRWNRLPDEERAKGWTETPLYASAALAPARHRQTRPVEDEVERAVRAAAEIEMNREGTPYARTQEEFYEDAAEMVNAVLAALTPARTYEQGIEEAAKVVEKYRGHTNEWIASTIRALGTKDNA